MKKRTVIFVVLAVLTVQAFAQTAFDYLTDSLVNVLTVSTIVQIADFEYKGDNALWGTYLEPGKSIALNSQYDAGVEYLMLAAAHTKTSEIYLKVYQGQGTGGTVIAKDTTNDAAPMVRFKPSVSGWHCFELINVSNRPAFVSLVILKYKKNANFTFNSLVEALQNVLTVSKYVATLLPSGSEVPANEWTLFGGNINEGSAAGYYNSKPGKGAYVLVGAGENTINNCDTEVIEQYAVGNTDGRKISTNTNSRYPFDIAVFAPGPSKYHYLRVVNQSSRNASAFIFGFLILAKN